MATEQEDAGLVARTTLRADGLTALSGPELVFGLVGAVGCDLEPVARLLAESLAAAKYNYLTVRVSSLLHQLDKYQGLANPASHSEYERIKSHMAAGTDLRKLSKRGDIMAWLSVYAIRELRKEGGPGLQSTSGDYAPPLNRAAFIIRSIKNPAEIQTLRDVYGRAFFVVSAYAPRDRRVDALANMIARSEGDSQSKNYRHQAEELVQRDEDEQVEGDLGQSVRDSFALADVFIDTKSHTDMKEGIQRFVDGIFG